MADSPNFIDYVKIFCRSGAGGKGSMHFHRDKLTSKGGPDGGDGGRGGHIIVRGNVQMWTLLHLKYTKHVHAIEGTNGAGLRMTGADGPDLILDVPLGTVVKDAETEEILFEITEEGQSEILKKGGHGGKGNWNYRTATNQTPTYVSPNGECEEGWVILELKVLADVGLVGFPNAGKSTLLSSITAAKPKIADYAFTTLVPQLGMVEYRDSRSFCMADLPGIIEGAAEGKGLGHRFLRHIERNAVLLFLIPADSKDHRKEFEILKLELEKYNREMLQKDFVIAISKSDMLDEELKEAIAKELPKNIPHVFISSVTGYQLQQLKDLLWNTLNTTRI
jgi:GTP-binding protein